MVGVGVLMEGGAYYKDYAIKKLNDKLNDHSHMK